MKIEIDISDGLLNAVKDLIYEEEWDLQEKDLNDFIIESIVEKFNNDNNLFSVVFNTMLCSYPHYII